MKRNFAMRAPMSLSVIVVLLLYSPTHRDQAVAEVEAQSVEASKELSVDEEVKQLIAILRDRRLREREPERVVQAINRLGEIKSVKAIDDLVALLTFRRIFDWEKERHSDLYVEVQLTGTDGRYPATGALFQIGVPALPALTRVIETNESGSLQSQNAIYTVEEIFREKPEDAVAYLREAAATAPSAEAAQRLWQAVERSAERLQRLKRIQEQERLHSEKDDRSPTDRRKP